MTRWKYLLLRMIMYVVLVLLFVYIAKYTNLYHFSFFSFLLGVLMTDYFRKTRKGDEQERLALLAQLKENDEKLLKDEITVQEYNMISIKKIVDYLRKEV